MNKNIAIVASLVVVVGVLLINPISRNSLSLTSQRLSLPSFSFSLPPLTLGGLKSSSVDEEAFKVFKQYLEFARKHDLQGVRSLSHQSSEACMDEERMKECYGLMDGVYNFGKVFQKDDFGHVFYDDRQLVMITDPIVYAGSTLPQTPMRYALLFTRTSDGDPKLLSIKICLPTQAPNLCVETDQEKRDKNVNGWWDDVETLFIEPR